MATLIKDMYNFVANETGFPEYSDSISGTTTVGYILGKLNQGFEKVVSDLVTRTGSLQRVREYTTMSGVQKYLIDGIIQSVTLDGHRLNLKLTEPSSTVGTPVSYHIGRDGSLLLDPIPSGEFKLVVQTSTKNIVLSNNDTPRNYICDIDDEILLTFEMSQAISYAAIGMIREDFNLNPKTISAIYESLLDYATELELKTIEVPRKPQNRISGCNLLEF